MGPDDIFAKGGAGNVRRLGVAIARIRFDRSTGAFHVGALNARCGVRETPWTTGRRERAGNRRRYPTGPDVAVRIRCRCVGSIYVAVGAYGPPRNDGARGSIRSPEAMTAVGHGPADAA